MIKVNFTYQNHTKARKMKGVLLVNLGSPDSPTAKDVKPYLDQFLMDERVIDVNPILRNVLVRGLILQTRPKKSAAAYAKIWWDEGSPLIVISKRFAKKVQEQTNMPVALRNSCCKSIGRTTEAFSRDENDYNACFLQKQRVYKGII